MRKNTTSEYCVKRTESGPIYFRARWLKSRKSYRLYRIYPGCEDVHWKIRPGFWSFDPVELVNESRKLKSRPSNKTLTQAWLIKS
tara:strand:- start:1641 stop:1895 length:255 start_codon:yes stop_codon:yes gene_type:complete